MTDEGGSKHLIVVSQHVVARRRLKNNQVKEVVFLIVHARVPIPRKGSYRLKLFLAMAKL